MRAAPAVTLELPASLRWDVGVAALGAASAAAFVAAVCSHLPLSLVASGLCIATCSSGGAWLAWRFRPPGGGRLRWDGTAWWWRASASGAVEEPGSLHVMIDLGRWMLLRFDAPAAGLRAWLPVSSRLADDGPLRAAVYSRALSPASAARRARESE